MVNLMNLALPEKFKTLTECRSIEVSTPGTLEGTSDLCMHPLESSEALLMAGEMNGPRYNIQHYRRCTEGGRRHALLLPVNCIVKGLNRIALHAPHLEGWSGISAPEVVRYMCWAGYDTLILQHVPVMQNHTTLGRWNQLETFVEMFAKIWEKEVEELLEKGGGEYSGNGRRHSTDSAYSDASRSVDNPNINFGTTSKVKSITSTVNPMMTYFASGAGANVQGEETVNNSGVGNKVVLPTFHASNLWPFYLRHRMASIVVENGDSFVRHAFKSRSVDDPYWFSVKGLLFRNRHLDVKGLYSHSYANETFRSRVSITSFVQDYVEGEGLDDLEVAFEEARSLWAFGKGAPGSMLKNIGQGKRLAIFAVEEVDTAVIIDPLAPPQAFASVNVGDEFNEANMLNPRLFSSVDIGYFLWVMQNKSIAAVVDFLLAPQLGEIPVFSATLEPVPMSHYISNETFMAFHPNRPRFAAPKRKIVGGNGQKQKPLINRSFSGAGDRRRMSGSKWGYGGVATTEHIIRVDAMSTPSLDVFLSKVSAERQRTGAVDLSAEGEEEADWVEAVLGQLKLAQQSVEATRLAEASASKSTGGELDTMRRKGEEDLESNLSYSTASSGEYDGEERAKECVPAGPREVPAWMDEQMPGLINLLMACRGLINDVALLQSMMDLATDPLPTEPRTRGSSAVNSSPPLAAAAAGLRREGAAVELRPKGDGGRGGQGGEHATPGRGFRTAMQTPARSPDSSDDSEVENYVESYEQDPLNMHWLEVEKLGKSDTLHPKYEEVGLVEDQFLSSYLEYSVGQPHLGTISSSRVLDVILSNLQFLVESGSLSPLNFDVNLCGPVKADWFKDILAKFVALTKLLAGSRGGSGKDSEGKVSKDVKAASLALLNRVGLPQIYSIMAALAAGGCTSVHNLNTPQGSSDTPKLVSVFVVEKQALSFNGVEGSEEHYGFHAVYSHNMNGLSIYIAKDHPNMAAGVFWCCLRSLGLPIMVCHLADCLMDCGLDCRWDTSTKQQQFEQALTAEGAAKLTCLGDTRPLKFLSETCGSDINQELVLREKACLLRMLAHGHGCITDHSSHSQDPAHSRSELAASFRIVSAWRQALVEAMRSVPNTRYLAGFSDNLHLPRLTINRSTKGMSGGVDPRRVLWWTFLAIPWSPSARSAVLSLLSVIEKAPPPRKATGPLDSRGGQGAKDSNKGTEDPGEHGPLWYILSDLLVTQLCTPMLVRNLALLNREESPFPPEEKHYHMVALELRGEDKTFIYKFLQTDHTTLGVVLNNVVRQECVVNDHSQAFHESKSLGTLHNVKHGDKNSSDWLDTGFGGRMKRFKEFLMRPTESPVLHGYSVGMYYSVPVLIELLLQLTGGGSIYTNSSIGRFQDVVPIALLHSLVLFGGLSLGAAKISSVNFFSFMMLKLVMSQLQFITAFIVLSAILFPPITIGAVLLYRDDLPLAITFVCVFFGVGMYIMLVSLMLATSGGKPWSTYSGRALLLAHFFLLITPLIGVVLDVVPKENQGWCFVGGVFLLFVTLVVGYIHNIRRIYGITKKTVKVVLTPQEMTKWKTEHSEHTDPIDLFYTRVANRRTAMLHPLTRARRNLLPYDLELLLLEFDSIRSATPVPKERWSKEWDAHLKAGHAAMVSVNGGSGMETASTMWALAKWDVCYGAAYFMMVFSDNLVNIWIRQKIAFADELSMLTLALFITATAGLESMMMVNLRRSNGWRFMRIDPTQTTMADASTTVGNALHKLYLWDFFTYGMFVIIDTGLIMVVGLIWVVPDTIIWDTYTMARGSCMLTGYVGILIGLFHKILFGGSITRQRISFRVCFFSLCTGLLIGLFVEAANAYIKFSDRSLAFVTLGVTGFCYALYSVLTYRKFRVQLSSQGFASGQLLSTPSLGTAGQRLLGLSPLHLGGREARAVVSCRQNCVASMTTKGENNDIIRRTLFRQDGGDPSAMAAVAPKCLRQAFGNMVPVNDDFFRWRIMPVADQFIVPHGFNALVDPENTDIIYVANSVYSDRNSLAECLLHETYEWAYGSHQMGVLGELLQNHLPARMKREIAGRGSSLPRLVDRTLPCIVEALTRGSCKNDIVWGGLTQHSREVIIRIILTQPAVRFEFGAVAGGVGGGVGGPGGHVAVCIVDDDGVRQGEEGSSNLYMSTDSSTDGLEPGSELELANRVGCKDGRVLLQAVLEASDGEEPITAVARGSVLAGLSECVMEYVVDQISEHPRDGSTMDLGSAIGGGRMERHRSTKSHLPDRFRLRGLLGANSKSYGNQELSHLLGRSERVTNVEALLTKRSTIFPSSSSFPLDYVLFASVTGCIGFDREAFVLALDQNSNAINFFLKVHRISGKLYMTLLHLAVLQTDVAVSDILETVETKDMDKLEMEAAGVGTAMTLDPNQLEGGGAANSWLVSQRFSLSQKIRGCELPIAFAQWLDHMILRKEPLLQDYWQSRDEGHFSEALLSLKLVERDLELRLETGKAAGLSTVDDLATFAKCGSSAGLMRASKDGDGAVANSIRRQGTWATDIKQRGGVCVLTLDSGTWPLYGGGVAVCRKQLLDDTVGRVRWNTLFEVSLPAPLPTTVDTPENVRQMVAVPLWSQNAGGAYETFGAHSSFLTRRHRETRTNSNHIMTYFIPQLKTLIDLANTPSDEFTVDGMETGAHAIAELYSYFQVFDWEITWKAGVTHDVWAASWLACSARDKQRSPLLMSEKPCLAELHEVLNYWQTLLISLQVDLPEMNGSNRGVVHVSHHGTQALVGVAAKRLLGWGLIVWDHGMLWRERTKAIAELHSSSLFVRKSLISLHRLVAKVTLYVADSLTPCTQMNKHWEMRVVSETNERLRDMISRKVNPVLNGAPSTIKPTVFVDGKNADGKSDWVTVVMLSHVYALKGVLTAVQAADVIVHRYNLKKYRIMIYGSTTHDVNYFRRCQDAIDRMKLNDNCKLCGKGSPAAVLAQGDLFLNSSVSEGLPLAIIEASRAGLVVTATDVGGTRDVVGEFGAVCRPNDPLELARSQLEALAACKKWCKLDGSPNLDWMDLESSADRGEKLEKAIFEPDVVRARQAWGTRYMEWTCKEFTLERYRDEHVRALWLADRQAQETLARLSLSWTPDANQRNLACAYAQLRKLVDLVDRKEHTYLRYVEDVRVFQARMNEELASFREVDLCTDSDLISHMATYQSVTTNLPLVHWMDDKARSLSQQSPLTPLRDNRNSFGFRSRGYSRSPRDPHRSPVRGMHTPLSVQSNGSNGWGVQKGSKNSRNGSNAPVGKEQDSVKEELQIMLSRLESFEQVDPNIIHSIRSRLEQLGGVDPPALEEMIRYEKAISESSGASSFVQRAEDEAEQAQFQERLKEEQRLQGSLSQPQQNIYNNSGRDVQGLSLEEGKDEDLESGSESIIESLNEGGRGERLLESPALSETASVAARRARREEMSRRATAARLAEVSKVRSAVTDPVRRVTPATLADKSQKVEVKKRVQEVREVREETVTKRAKEKALRAEKATRDAGAAAAMLAMEEEEVLSPKSELAEASSLRMFEAARQQFIPQGSVESDTRREEGRETESVTAPLHMPQNTRSKRILQRRDSCPPDTPLTPESKPRKPHRRSSSVERVKEDPHPRPMRSSFGMNDAMPRDEPLRPRGHASSSRRGVHRKSSGAEKGLLSESPMGPSPRGSGTSESLGEAGSRRGKRNYGGGRTNDHSYLPSPERELPLPGKDRRKKADKPSGEK